MIKSIRIKNYRTCKDVKINLKEPLMALIGKNAAGKTNTLKGIYYACRACLMNSGEAEIFNLQKGFSAEFELEVERERLTQSFIYKYQVYGDQLYIKDTLWTVVNKKKRRVFKKTDKRILTLYLDDDTEKTIPIPFEYTGLKYAPRIDFPDVFPSSLFKTISRNIYSFRSYFNGVEYYANQQQSEMIITFKNEYETWIGRDRYADVKELFTFEFYDFYKVNSEEFNEYKEILILLGLVEDINVQTAQVGGEANPNAIIYITFLINGKELKFSSLSDGTRRIIRLLFHLFYDEATLMLIEEPESSIHWNLLTKFLSVLDQYTDKTKVLFSTHSEQVLNYLEPEQLIYVNNIGGETKIKNLTGSVLKSTKSYLSDIGPLGEYFTSGELEGDLDG